MSEEDKQILDDLYQTIKSIPQNPVTQLDETNTVLHILAVKEEIDKTTDEKLKKDYQWLLSELEIHLEELQRNSDNKWLSYSPLEEIIKKDCERTFRICTF